MNEKPLFEELEIWKEFKKHERINRFMCFMMGFFTGIIIFSLVIIIIEGP